MPMRPRSRQRLHVAPQKIVIELLVGRLLEAEHLAALRVHSGHDVLDRAVLAGRVHGLEHDQHRVHIGGVEQLLCRRQLRDVLLQVLDRTRLQFAFSQILELAVARPARVVVLQAEFPTGLHLEQSRGILERKGHPSLLCPEVRGKRQVFEAGTASIEQHLGQVQAQQTHAASRRGTCPPPIRPADADRSRVVRIRPETGSPQRTPSQESGQCRSRRLGADGLRVADMKARDASARERLES